MLIINICYFIYKGFKGRKKITPTLPGQRYSNLKSNTMKNTLNFPYKAFKGRKKERRYLSKDVHFSLLRSFLSNAGSSLVLSCIFGVHYNVGNRIDLFHKFVPVDKNFSEISICFIFLDAVRNIE